MNFTRLLKRYGHTFPVQNFHWRIVCESPHNIVVVVIAIFLCDINRIVLLLRNMIIINDELKIWYLWFSSFLGQHLYARLLRHVHHQLDHIIFSSYDIYSPPPPQKKKINKWRLLPTRQRGAVIWSLFDSTPVTKDWGIIFSTRSWSAPWHVAHVASLRRRENIFCGSVQHPRCRENRYELALISSAEAV